jgi:hypothetical protein
MFLNPWMLWGLLGISVPIIIHLLNRFRRRRIEWGAMELLRRALVLRSRQIQLEDWLILALRCLVIALVALALARPRTRAGAGQWLGAGQGVAAVIAVDASFSMACNPGVQSRFDRARQSVRAIQQTLDEGAPVSLVLLGHSPRILLRNLAYHKPRFDKALDTAQPLPERLNLELGLEQLAALLDEARGSVRECYLVTDAQAVSWGELSEKSRALLNRLTTQANVFFLTTARDAADNLALTDLTLASGALRQGGAARYVATVRNTGPAPVEKVAVTLLRNESAVDRRLVDRLEPGQSAAVPLFARFESAGPTPLIAVLDHDALPVDNARHAVAMVRERVRVLCVDGAPAIRPFESETDYLRTALAPGRPGRAGAGLTVESVPWQQFSTARLGDTDLLVLANVPELRPDHVEAIYHFVQQGAGLVVFLGNKVHGPLLNERLQVGPAFLLPAEVAEPVRAPEELAEGWFIEPATDAHRLAHIVRTLPPDLMSEVRLRQHFKLALLPAAQTVLQVGGSAAPWLVEQRLGQGRVLLFASNANRAWSDWPVHPSFPILMQEIVTHLTAGSDDAATVVGQPLRIPLPGAGLEASIIVRDPAGAEFPVQVGERQGRRMAEHGAAERPGFYEARLGETNGVLLAPVNVDPAESDVRTLAADDLRAALAGLPLRFLDESADLAAVIRESRIGREWWRELLLAALGVLALESFLAWHFSRRIRVTEQLPTGRGEAWWTDQRAV